MPWALLVYKHLSENGFDVFFDFEGISSGDFEQIIIGNIKARAHFIVILTPYALDRCNQPGDWLRREIETALVEKRNIIPLFFDGFSFGKPSVSKMLTGELDTLKKYNGLDVPGGYFDRAMERLREKYLNITLDAVLHPVSGEVQKVTDKQKFAANEAIAQQNEKEVFQSDFSIIQEFKIRSSDFFVKPLPMRREAANEIRKLTKELQIDDILQFVRSSIPGERVATGIALGEKIKNNPTYAEMHEVRSALQNLLLDRESRVRFRALELIGYNKSLIEHFQERIEEFVYDENKSIKKLAEFLLRR